jgi:hypothetical protein
MANLAITRSYVQAGLRNLLDISKLDPDDADANSDLGPRYIQNRGQPAKACPRLAALLGTAAGRR